MFFFSFFFLHSCLNIGLNLGKTNFELIALGSISQTSLFYYLFSNPPYLAEACYKLSMLSRYAPITYLLNFVNMLVIVNRAYV